MPILVFRVLLYTMSLLSLLIILILLQPYEYSQAQEFIGGMENCGGSCLMGIQPGKTRVGDTMRWLQSHEWVHDLRQDATGNGFSTISWGWNGNQPTVIDQTRRGRITFYWVDEDVIQLDDSIVETVTVYTKIPHFLLQQWMGETNGGEATARPDGKLGYSVLYDIEGGTLNLYIETPCPFSLMGYWNSRTRITLSIGRLNAGFVEPTQLHDFCQTANN